MKKEKKTWEEYELENTRMRLWEVINNVYNVKVLRRALEILRPHCKM